MRLDDLGLPPKFNRWRPGQLEAVVEAATSETRFTILNLPPGTGKSPAGIAIASILGGRTMFLTQTKGLQAQFMGDFGSSGLFEIKGQSNYPCIALEDEIDYKGNAPGCDEGPCHAGIECHLREMGCHYYDTVRRSCKSSLVIANYSYWMHVNRYAAPGSLGDFDTLIMDEAHDAVNTLSDFVRIHLNKREVKKLIGVDMIRSNDIVHWVEWAEYALKKCTERLENAKHGASLHRYSVKVVRELANLEANLADLMKARNWRRTDVPDPAAWVPGSSIDWVIEQDKKGAVFQPVWPAAYAESYLFNHIKRIIMVSATVNRRDATFLGVKPQQLTYRDYPSPFPRENRPVYVVPTVKVGRHMSVGEKRQWMNRIDQLIDNELGGKGIIHAVSYERASYIMEHSRHRNIMVGHDKWDTRSVIDDFKNRPAPAVLVSPSVGTGWDFPYDECRFQIVVKIPFIDNRPVVVKARAKQDPGYLNHVALVALIQMAGRGVRAEDDSCRTYIIDDNWRWFRVAVDAEIPRWFKAAIKPLRSAQELPPARSGVRLLQGGKSRW